MLRHMPLGIPVPRLFETSTLLAFWHPAPSYPFHIVIVPRAEIPSLAALDPGAHAEFLHDLYATVQRLIQEHRLPAYRLVVNGGDYQDFPHLHFHLISEQAKDV